VVVFCVCVCARAVQYLISLSRPKPSRKGIMTSVSTRSTTCEWARSTLNASNPGYGFASGGHQVHESELWGTSLSDGRPSRHQRQERNAHEPLDTLMTSYLGASSLATYSRMSKLSSANSTFGLGKR
jgi:hypothetical protein